MKCKIVMNQLLWRQRWARHTRLLVTSCATPASADTGIYTLTIMVVCVLGGGVRQRGVRSVAEGSKQVFK